MSTAPYIVIGSNCFTGSHVVDALLDDPANEVVGISRSPEVGALYTPYKARTTARFTFYQIDLVRQPEAVQALLDELQPAYVINVAALSDPVYVGRIRTEASQLEDDARADAARARERL